MEIDDAKNADNVETNPSKDQSQKHNKEISQEDNPDKEGVGQSQVEESKTGHKGQANAQQQSNRKEEVEKQEKRQRPGESDSQRSLGDANEPVKKKLKTMNIEDKNAQEEEEEEGGSREEEADMYQHIKEAKSKAEQVLDAATSEQAEQQKDVVNKMEEETGEEATENIEENLDEDGDVEMTQSQQKKAESMESKKKKEKGGKEVTDENEEGWNKCYIFIYVI